MHKAILIHSDNTPLTDIIDHKILFSPTIDDLNNSDIDAYISHEILPQINHEEFDVIYIRDTLSENYMDFYGLVLAYHIRLSAMPKEKSYMPIIILSDIDSYTINKITPLGKIFATSNIFLSLNNNNTVDYFNSVELYKLSNDEFESGFLNLIEISAPKDYLSHHSITNEWAIDQWAYFYGADSDVIQKNRNKISSMLYYKYLTKKHHLLNKLENTNLTKKKSIGKLLLIDDKANDGWNDVFNKFCEKHYTDVIFESLLGITKESDFEYLDNLLSKKVDSYDPDIIILDLRLLDNENSIININDDEKIKLEINKISGVKLLKSIKNINPSIQVIIFTASSNSIILDELYKNGILGYVKKDSPTDIYKASKNNFKKLDTLIKSGLNLKYLKSIWNIQEGLLGVPFLINTSDIDKLNLRTNIKSIFDIANSNIPNPFTYSMLGIYKCIELLNDIFIVDSYKDAKWNDDHGKPIKNNTDNSTKNYILNIIESKTNLEKLDFEEDINKIVCSRNLAIHTSIKPHCKNITVQEPKPEHLPEYFSEHKLKWYEMLYKVIDHIK